jgi:hypothetical protein
VRPAHCWIDPEDGAALHESSQSQIGDHVVSIMGTDEDTPAIQLDHETLTPAAARHRATQLEALA